MGRPWAHVGQEGKKTTLMVGRHTLLTSGDSLLLHVLTLAYCVITVFERHRHHRDFWLQGLTFGFLSCLLLVRLMLRYVHKRRNV